MTRARLTACVATLVLGCAVGAPVVITSASAASDAQPTATQSAASPTTTVSGPTVHTPASEQATVRAGAVLL